MMTSVNLNGEQHLFYTLILIPPIALLREVILFLITTNPAYNATGVVFNKIVTVIFRNELNSSLIDSTTLIIKQGKTVGEGAVTYFDKTVSFKPTNTLTANTVYTGTITTRAKFKDYHLRELAINYSWSFTTATASDVIKPIDLSQIAANMPAQYCVAITI